MEVNQIDNTINEKVTFIDDSLKKVFFVRGDNFINNLNDIIE